MSNADDGGAGELLWQRARLNYENHNAPVKLIAEELGLSPHALVREAKARGWKLRGQSKAAKPRQSTRTTLQRFKDLLQERLGQLEKQLQSMESEVTALVSERDIRAMNTLVRTLEKVLELERKDSASRAKQTREHRQFDAAAREELAARIAKLENHQQCESLGESAEHQRGASSAGGLALLGA